MPLVGPLFALDYLIHSFLFLLLVSSAIGHVHDEDALLHHDDRQAHPFNRYITPAFAPSPFGFSRSLSSDLKLTHHHQSPLRKDKELMRERERRRRHERVREEIERRERAERHHQSETLSSESPRISTTHTLSVVRSQKKDSPKSSPLLPILDPLDPYPVAPYVPRDTLSDPCSQLSQAPVPTHALVLACYNHFLHVPSAFNLTIHSILKTLPLYVFLDASSSPPPGSRVKPYNITQAIQSLVSRTSWPSARAALEALSDAFTPLNDGHTLFIPKCFRRIAYRQAIYPTASVDPETNGTHIHVGALSKLAPASWSSLLGAEIVTIDGEPAASHMWRYAQKHIGFFKDPVTRFTRAFASTAYHDSQWRVVPGLWAARTRPPREGSVIYGLRQAKSTGPIKNLTVPWDIALPKEGFTSAEDYWNKYCASPTNVTETVDIVSEAESTSSKRFPRPKSPTYPRGSMEGDVSLYKGETGERGSKEQEETKEEDKSDDLSSSPIPKAQPDQPILPSNDTSSSPPLSILPTIDQGHPPRRMSGGEGNDSSTRIPLLLKGSMALYTLTSAPYIGIIIVSTFTAITLEEQWTWREDFAQILQEFTRRRFTRLLLELGSNGGGNACLANEFLGALSPHTANSMSSIFPDLSYPFLKDARISPLLSQLVWSADSLKITSSTFSPTQYASYPSHRPFFSASSLMKPRALKGRADQGEYTQLFHDRCSLLPNNPIASAASRLSLPAHAIGIITDGMCASACGRVVIYLQGAHGVRTVVTTPIHDMSRSPVAFPASQVSGVPCGAQVLHVIHLSLTSRPSPLSV